MFQCTAAATVDVAVIGCVSVWLLVVIAYVWMVIVTIAVNMVMSIKEKITPTTTVLLTAAAGVWADYIVGQAK